MAPTNEMSRYQLNKIRTKELSQSADRSASGVLNKWRSSGIPFSIVEALYVGTFLLRITFVVLCNITFKPWRDDCLVNS